MQIISSFHLCSDLVTAFMSAFTLLLTLYSIAVNCKLVTINTVPKPYS